MSCRRVFVIPGVVGARSSAGAHGTSVLAAWGRPIVPGYELANVKLTADGEVEVHVGTHSHGHGHETSFAQVAHEILTVDFDRIRIYLQICKSRATAAVRGLAGQRTKNSAGRVVLILV